MAASPLKQLAGKVALITGSSQGIGYGIIRQLAAQGATVVMHGKVPESELKEKSAALANEMETHCGFRNADLTQSEAIKSMITSIQKEYGSLDILVNNAGIQHVAPVHEFPEDKWDAIIAILLSSVFHATKAALPGMMEQGWGRIVNTGSMHALVASPFKSAYNAAKHGVAGFTKTVALEVAETGVTCNAICPGYAFTDLVKNQLEDTARIRGMTKEQVITDVLLRDQPSKRFVEPEDIGALVAHLCGPHSSNITGACLSIDGGWVAR